MTHIFTTRTAAILLTLLIGLAPVALAQSTMIKGKVVDAKNQPVPGVTITIGLGSAS